MDQGTWPPSDDQGGSPQGPPPPGFAPPESAPPGFAPPDSAPPGPPPGSAPPWPAPAPPPVGLTRYRRPWAAILVAVLVAAGIATFTAVNSGSHGTTESVRVITPAPPVAGGLSEDVSAESQPAFQSQVASVKHKLASLYHVTSGAVALYIGQLPGVPGRAGFVGILYAGFNVPENDNTSGEINAALKGAAGHLADQASAPAGAGGPGDTAYACETGSVSQIPVSVCGWATDRTLALLIYYGSDPQAKKLNAFMRKMRPDLIRT